MEGNMVQLALAFAWAFALASGAYSQVVSMELVVVAYTVMALAYLTYNSLVSSLIVHNLESKVLDIEEHVKMDELAVEVMVSLVIFDVLLIHHRHHRHHHHPYQHRHLLVLHWLFSLVHVLHEIYHFFLI
jgi:hypothetical protein